MTRLRVIPHPPRPAAAPAGFTLIELMVSIALVLILILGINQVFKIASDTVNAGQSLSRADRDNRAIQGVMFPDFQNMVLSGSPCLIIRSEALPAFRNKTDEQADRDGKPLTTDMDGDNEEGKGSVPGEVISPGTYNSRNHRLDELMFFATGLYHRQTGAGSNLSVNGSSNEVFIWYGLTRQPNNRVDSNNEPVVFYRPGDPDSPVTKPTNWQSGDKNDNNKYASQWVLGRVPILLAGDNYIGNNDFIERPNTADSTSLSPLAVNSMSSDGKVRLQDAVYDVAQTSIAGYRDIVSRYAANPRNSEPWWNVIAQANFDCDLRPLRPLTARKVARTVPAFVQGCTQFIVEYTGDFLAQDTTPGSPTEGFVTGSPVLNGGTGDGVTDFVMAEVPLRPNDKNSPTTRVRRTRWYGMPRNVDTWDDLKKGNGRPLIQGGQGATSPNDLVDVVPLRDVLATYPPIRGRGVVPAFEQSLNDRQTGLAMRPNYADGKPLGRYAAAWGPGELSPTSPLKPTMIRITIVIDDPTGRMSEGQTYEYVFKLP